MNTIEPGELAQRIVAALDAWEGDDITLLISASSLSDARRALGRLRLAEIGASSHGIYCRASRQQLAAIAARMSTSGRPCADAAITIPRRLADGLTDSPPDQVEVTLHPEIGRFGPQPQNLSRLRQAVADEGGELHHPTVVGITTWVGVRLGPQPHNVLALLDSSAEVRHVRAAVKGGYR